VLENVQQTITSCVIWYNYDED